MTPPNFFRFVRTDYVEPPPSEDNPVYPTWNNQFRTNSAQGTTTGISNFTVGTPTGSMVGDVSYNSNSSYNNSYYLQATGEANTLDIRSGSIVFEFQPDSSKTPSNWGWKSMSAPFRFRPLQLDGDTQWHQYVEFSPNNWNSSGYYESWTSVLHRTTGNGDSANQTTGGTLQFHTGGSLVRKTSDYQFRCEIHYANGPQTRVKLKVMARDVAVADSISWEDIDTNGYNNVQYWVKSSANTLLNASTDDDYKFYPGIFLRNSANPGSGKDVSFKYFKMFYGTHDNS